jgi:hypothetical protein
MRKAVVAMGLVLGLFVLHVNLWPGTSEQTDRAALAKAVAEPKVSLEQGLSASAREGKPISAKFEMEEGKLQLSVYAAKGDKFSEVIVDHNTGKVAKSEAITSGEDLTAAKAQSEAMSKAKQSLRAAVAQARKANPGFRALSVVPSLKDGHPFADVTLAKGDEWKTVSEPLE